MKNFFLISAFLLFIMASCNNETENSIFSQAPYDKISDSIKMAPNNPDLYYRRGGLLYSNNQLEYSEIDLLKAWSLNPKEEYALSIITVLKQKNTNSAIAFIESAIKKLPNSIALKIGLARGYQQKNELDKAIAICNEILERYPKQLDAMVLKSDILKAQNKNSEALDILEKAYSYAPMDKDLAYDLAYDYAASKNAKAISLADTLIKKDSTETVARAYYVKATYFVNINNTNEAIKNYNASIAHDYNFLDSYLDKGKLFYNQKKYKDAQNVFTLALKVSPTTAEFYFWLAKSQEALGNAKEAKLNYQRAYGLDQSMKEAKESGDRISN